MKRKTLIFVAFTPWWLHLQFRKIKKLHLDLVVLQ